jgi:hypothetical protein
MDTLALRLAKHVYKDDTGGDIKFYNTNYIGADGFAASLYEINGHNYLVARGTQMKSLTDLTDWIQNFIQGYGFKASQYRQAEELAKQIFEQTEGNVTFIGHSLGGGLAMKMADAVGGRAITFNSAGLHPKNRLDNYKSIRSHVIKGEVLNSIQDGVSPILNFLGDTHRYVFKKLSGTNFEHPFFPHALPTTIGDRFVHEPKSSKLNTISKHDLESFKEFDNAMKIKLNGYE